MHIKQIIKPRGNQASRAFVSQKAYRSLCLTALLSLALMLGACGFTLRGSQALPPTLDTVVINASIQYNPLTRALSRRLPVYQLNSINADSNELESLDPSKVVLLSMQPESLERRLLSVFSSGQVAEYELIYSVDYQVTFPNAAPINNTMSVSREYQDDPQQILAKSRELELVMNEMRAETADRIIRLLSSQYTLAQSNANTNNAVQN
ncbi:LPS assembly lipoprotein LptE [Glaciecola siphonariae]|uniref:LPS-assembly lipoprotein LptE n=1 Tax=Glaciecola siphonariae TaxID=521012 RepID=A0ABV9LUB9_9ALTE